MYVIVFLFLYFSDREVIQLLAIFIEPIVWVMFFYTLAGPKAHRTATTHKSIINSTTQIQYNNCYLQLIRALTVHSIVGEAITTLQYVLMI